MPHTKPTIHIEAFPNTASSRFWSAFSYTPAPAYAWVVIFIDGGTGADYKCNNYFVRLVRNGQ